MKNAFKTCGIILFGFWALPKTQCQSIIGVEASYGFPWAGDEISDGNIISSVPEIRKIEVINWSFGAGRSYSMSYSHFLTPSIEVKCVVSYLDGCAINRIVNFPNSNTISRYKANAFWLSPTLAFNLTKKKVRPYAYAGFSLGVKPKIQISDKTVSNGSTTESKFVFSGGSVVGISCGIGSKFYFKENAKWHFSAEARLISASYGPKKGALTQYHINGTDVLNSLTFREKNTVYKDNYVLDESIPQNPNEPEIYPRRFYPFSSLGLNIGIFYAL